MMNSYSASETQYSFRFQEKINFLLALCYAIVFSELQLSLQEGKRAPIPPRPEAQEAQTSQTSQILQT